MATPLDRSDLSDSQPNPKPWVSQPFGLTMTIVGLVLALLAVVLVQGRQFALLRDSVKSAPEYSVMLVYQAEFEYQRLLEQWRLAANSNQKPDERALRLRYDIWVSRINLLNTGNVQRLAKAQPEDRATLERAQRFISRVDGLLGIGPDPSANDARTLLTTQFLIDELPNLRALAGPIHDMTLSAAETVAREAETRTARVQELNTLGLALTSSLCLLTLAFALMALHQLRKAKERRVALEQLTERLRLAQQTAERANAAKSEFLANMSHEVRTPFHGMVGMLSLLRETGLNEKQANYLRTATESADHLLAVLNDILDLSQLETGFLRFSTAPVELRSLLRDVEALVRPLALAKGLDLHVDIAPDAPEQALLDPVRVRQILYNLLSNAIKFTERGAVAMDLRVRWTAAQEAANSPNSPNTANGFDPINLEVNVSDTGVGMSAPELAHIFDRFHRLQTKHSVPAQGAGLGLEIARKLARAMKGDIKVRSQQGQGSCFTLSLPLTEAASAHPAQTPSTSRSNFGQRRLNLLVAEDHPVNRQYMDELLKGLGHLATFAVDGSQAVSMARDNTFDLVLMDLHMPIMDGIAATRIIRALSNSQRATVPIIALTADAFNETRDRCLVAGMNGFLSKPVMPDKLISTLRRLYGPVDAGTGVNAGPPKGEIGLPTLPDGAQASSPNTAARTLLANGATSDDNAEGTHGAAGRETTIEGTAESRPSEASSGPKVGSMAPEQALVDLQGVRLLLKALSAERYAEMASVYFEQAPLTVEHLRSAVRDGLPLDVRTNAHAARGAALNLGLTGLSATAQALQQGAAHLPAHEIARLVKRFEDQITPTRKALVLLDLMPGERVERTETSSTK